MPARGLNVICFESIESTTYLMPDIVRLVSAMFVATTHFLDVLGSRALLCWAAESPKYSGRTHMSGQSAARTLQTVRMSSSPGRKIRIPPFSA